MLKLIVSGELWNGSEEKFITINPTVLKLEHSLLSISKWEQKYHKAFLSDRDKTTEEMEYYIKCMTLNEEDINENIYMFLSEKDYSEIEDYMNNSMSATFFWDDEEKVSTAATPSERIYCQMFSFGIPLECEKWHINRLIALIRTFNVERGDKKLSPAEIQRRNRILNEQRRKEAKMKREARKNNR